MHTSVFERWMYHAHIEVQMRISTTEVIVIRKLQRME